MHYEQKNYWKKFEPEGKSFFSAFDFFFATGSNLYQ